MASVPSHQTISEVSGRVPNRQHDQVVSVEKRRCLQIQHSHPHLGNHRQAVGGGCTYQLHYRLDLHHVGGGREGVAGGGGRARLKRGGCANIVWSVRGRDVQRESS